MPTPPEEPGTPTILDHQHKTDSDGKIFLVLDWNNVSGTGVTYEVEQREVGNSWKSLPFGPFSISFTGSKAEVRYPINGKVYEHRVKSMKGGQSSAWSNKVTTTMPPAIPHLGHQEDHTSKYVIAGSPSLVILQAVSTAVIAWNNAVSGSWPNLLFCGSNDNDCETKNTDKFTTKIQTASGEDGTNKGSTKNLILASVPTDTLTKIIGLLPSIPIIGPILNPVLLKFFNDYFGDADCGVKTACIKPNGLRDIEPFVRLELDDGKSAPGQHMRNLIMVIEDPAWYYNKRYHQHTRYVWTNNHDDDGKPGPEPRITLVYLPSVVMHEFGHTAGLTDLYNYKDDDKPIYPGYLMNDTRGFIKIPTLDINYIKQVYRNEHGTEPH